MKNILILIFLFLVQCKSWDYHPDLLVGTTFKDPHLLKDIRKIDTKSSVYFLNKVPIAQLIEEIELNYHNEIFFLKGGFGRFLGQTNNSTGNFESIIESKMQKIDPESDNILIVHNIRIAYRTNFILELWNFFGTPISYSPYKIRFEIGQAPKSKLQEYLSLFTGSEKK